MAMQHIEKIVINENRKTINLEARGLTTENLRYIVELVNARKNPLDELALSGNNINDEGAKVLSSLQKVKSLDVSVNNISDEGVKFLITNTPIVSLDISANNLTNKIVDILLSSSQLFWINVERNRDISSENKKKLKAHIAQNKLLAQCEAAVLSPESKVIDLLPKEQNVTKSSVLALSNTRSPLHTAPNRTSSIPSLERNINLENIVEKLKLDIHKAEPKQAKSAVLEWVADNFDPIEVLEVIAHKTKLAQLIEIILQKADPEELEQIAQLINKTLSPTKVY